MNRANLIEIFGGSQSTGYGTAAQEYGWPALACSALGAFEANYSANSIVLAQEGNGFAKYLRPAAALRARQAGPYVSPVDATIFHLGLGDLAANMLNGGAYTPGAYRAALDAVLAFAALGGYFGAEPAGNSHPSIAYGGTWADSTRTDANVGAGTRATLTPGSTLTITVPSDFPGGEIDLFWVVPWSGNGGTWRIIVDGPAGRYGYTETITAADADQVTSLKPGLKATRLQGLAPGAYTITATLTAVAAFGVAFDGWGIRAVNPPALVVVEQPRLTPSNYAAWLGPFAGDTPTDEGVAQLNRLAATVAEQAGATFMALESIYLTPALTIDGAHPNERGAARLAAQILKNLAALPDTLQAPNRPQLPAPYAANWANDTSPYAPLTWSPGPGRRVRLTGRAKRTGTPSPGETILTLPEGMRPAATASYLCPGSTGTPTVTIDNTGAVKYAAGSLGAAGTIDLDNVEYTAKAVS